LKREWNTKLMRKDIVDHADKNHFCAVCGESLIFADIYPRDDMCPNRYLRPHNRKAALNSNWTTTQVEETIARFEKELLQQ